MYNRGPAAWVRLGVANLKRQSNAQDLRVVERIRHDKYKSTFQYNDIALLKLEKPAKMNGFVRPACLSLENTITPGEKSLASGWGVVEFRKF